MYVKSNGVTFLKKAFENTTFEQFKETYEKQVPFKSMIPKAREKALREAWGAVKPDEEKKRKKGYEIVAESKPND